MADETPDPTRPDPSKPDGMELACTGILRAEFGRRPTRAVNKAILQLAAEEALTSHPPAASLPVWRERIRNWLAGWRQRPALAFGLVLVAGAAWFYQCGGFNGSQPPATSGPVCAVSDAMAARWASNSLQPKVGDKLRAGSMRLESGVVELTFNSAAKVAVEGPAEFKLTSANSMELQSGKISTEVPHRARGFTVKLPVAEVVDLGTRFGAIVSGDQSSEVDVFQGKVRLTPMGRAKSPPDGCRLTEDMAMLVDDHGAMPARGLPEAAFPRPNLSTLARPQNCGFDVAGRAALGGVPVAFGYWSGPAYALVNGAVEDIEPASGPGMLQFSNPSADPVADSTVWQAVDMHPFQKMLADGQTKVILSALFNRIRDETGAGKIFGLTLAAFHGSPADAQLLWANRKTTALALADGELTADDNPATWEKIEVSAQIPATTDFVIVELRAIAPSSITGKTPSLAGHFADLVDLKLVKPMQASSLTISR